jgi:hypothetical protein
LASDGATDVYLADARLALGFLRNVDFESLIELDSDQAQRSIRDAYAIANKERRKRKLYERHAEARRRPGHGIIGDWYDY